MRILIAEDDLVSSRVLATTLRKWGHEVVTSVDGLEAWAALQMPDAPRLAILDWMMPGIEGPEICRRVRGKTDTADMGCSRQQSKSQPTDRCCGHRYV